MRSPSSRGARTSRRSGAMGCMSRRRRRFRGEAGRGERRPEAVGPVDTVIVGVKAWQVPGPPPRSGHCWDRRDSWCRSRTAWRRRIKSRRPWGASGYWAASAASPHSSQIPGRSPCWNRPSVEFGERDNRRSDRAVALLAAFAGATGVTASIPNDIEAAIWEKFLFIAPFSGVGAVTRRPAGALPKRARLARAPDGRHGGGRAPCARPRRGAPVPTRSRARNNSSMPFPRHHGFDAARHPRGRPSELEAQNGAVVRLGRAARVAVPVNEHIYRTLLPAEQRARTR